MAESTSIAVVGAGIGWFHIMAVLKARAAGLPVCLAAVCDLDEGKAQAAIEKAAKEVKLPVPEVPIVADYEELLRVKDDLGLTGVTIAVPNDKHAPFSIGALEAGLHVLCEKPLSNTIAGAREMVVAAQAHPSLRADVVLNNSVRPEMDFISGLLAEGGDVQLVRAKWLRDKGIPFRTKWFGKKAISGGGPIMDLAPHCIGQAMTLLQWPTVVSVTGSTWNTPGVSTGSGDGPYGSGFVQGSHVYDVEDSGMMLANLDIAGTKVPLIVEVSWAANVPGEEMSLWVQLESYSIELKRIWPVNDGDDGKAVDTLRVIGKMKSPGGLWAPTETIINPYSDPASKDPWMGRVTYVDRWLRSTLDTSITPIASFSQGAIIQEIIDAWYQSAMSWKPTELGAVR